MSLALPLTFTNYIRNAFGIGAHPTKEILEFVAQISHDSINVRFIDGSAFSNVSEVSISTDSENATNFSVQVKWYKGGRSS
jgi:hypothetical protein